LKRHEAALRRFLEDGRLPLTNNHSERELRSVAVPVSLRITSSSAWNHERGIVAGITTRATDALAAAA
jgi:hypothetical protein